MESAINLFRKLPETKGQVSKYHDLIKDSVLNGEVDPLLFMQQITALELLFKNLKSDELIKEFILNEAEKYGKSFEKENAKYNIKEVGVKYDFTNCDDMEWNMISEELRLVSEKKKEREAFLKSIKPDMEVYGSDGTQLKPAIKTSTTQVTITLK